MHFRVPHNNSQKEDGSSYKTDKGVNTMIYGQRNKEMYEYNKRVAFEICEQQKRFGANLHGQRVFIFAEMPDGTEEIIKLQPDKPFPKKYYYMVQYQNTPNPKYVETFKELAAKGVKHFVAVADVRMIHNDDTSANLVGMLLTWCRTASKESGVEMTDFLYVVKDEYGVDTLSNEELIELCPPPPQE